MNRRRAPSWSERCYRALVAVIYPRRFRDRFGEELGDLFRDRLHDARSQGGARAVAVLWLRIVVDLISSSLRERVSEVALRRQREAIDTSDSPFPNRHVSLPRALLADARFALRVFRKNPIFVGIAVLVVSLGTGAVSTIFSVANAIVLRPIPGVPDASRVVEVARTRKGENGTLSASYPYYQHLRKSTKTLSGVAAWAMVSVVATPSTQGVAILGNAVSGNYFSVLGVRPALGSMFSGDDDVALMNEGVGVISYAFWQRQFGGDSGIVGRSMRVNGIPTVIIGVAPPRFTGVYPALRTDIWLPLGMRSRLHNTRDGFNDPNMSYMQLVGALRPGVSRDVARDELSTLTAQFASSQSIGEGKAMSEYTAAKVYAVAGVPGEVAGAVAGFFTILLAIAALVLMIASVNVASMLLARAVVRRREIALRMALGASKRRLVRQLLVESVMLFSVGGAAGTLLAFWGTRLLQRIELPIDVPLELDFTPDGRVLVVTLVVAIITGILFGLAPALQGSRLDVQSTLRSDSAGSGRRKSRLRDGLIVGQIAMSLLLLSSAGLFIRALGRGKATDPGFSADGVVTANIDVQSAGYDEAKARLLFRELSDRMAAVPTVEAVAWGRILPLSMNTIGYDVSVPGFTPPNGKPDDAFGVSANLVDGAYFAALKIPIIRGRAFTKADDEHSAHVAIVSESFVRRYFGDREALGATIRRDSVPVTIIGISKDAKFGKLDEENEAFLYLPTAQEWRSTGNILVRTRGAPEMVSAALLREMAALDPALPPPRITTLRQATAVALLPQRVAAAVTGALGVIGLLLAAVGLYGVLSFSTAQRTRELGVRLALGASRMRIMRLVLRDGIRLVAVGVSVGFALAFLATRALRPFLFGLNPLDPLTFVVIALTLVGVSVMATAIPAHRASTTDPMLSMREE